MLRDAGFKLFRGLYNLCSPYFDQLLKTITILLQFILRPFLVGDVTPYTLNEVSPIDVDNSATYVDVLYLELLSNVVEIPSSMFSVSSSHLPTRASFVAGEFRP